MYLLKNPSMDWGINLMTSIDEITPAFLTEITKLIELSKHYTIIALAYKTTLFNLSANNGSIGKDNIFVTPIIAKTADTDNSPSPVKKSVGLIPVIAPSSIERGHEVHINIKAHINNVLKYINTDDSFRISLFQKKYEENVKSMHIIPTPNIVLEDNNTPVYCLSFKIVPNTDIVATNEYDGYVNDITFYSEKANN